MKKIIYFTLASLFLLSCERIAKQDVMILYPNWAEGIAITNLAQVILEDNGYVVKTKRLEPGPIFTSLSRGDADIYMDAWLPHTHKDYWTKYGDKLEILGTVFDDGITGLVVPTYVDIDSIDELNENKDRFDGKIFGIAAGAGIHTNTGVAIEKYKLDYQQVSSSETTMLTALKRATARKEWIVVTGWKPHFMWAEYDLKTLKDPLGIYPKDEIKVVSRRNFSQEKPEIAEFFSNFILDEDLLHELMFDVSAYKDPSVGAKLFYKKHENLIQNWIKRKG